MTVCIMKVVAKQIMTCFEENLIRLFFCSFLKLAGSNLQKKLIKLHVIRFVFAFFCLNKKIIIFRKISKYLTGIKWNAFRVEFQ